MIDELDAAGAYVEDVITPLADWAAQGIPSALVTIVAIDGASPRPAGAQMAVRGDGRWAGYISGGCLEAAIAQEALEVIGKDQPRLIRYGKGSPYFDIKLPCGSGLDIFIQPVRNLDLLRDMARRIAARQPFSLGIDLASGDWSLGAKPASPLERRDHAFNRVYTPALRLVIAGSSPVAPALASIADAAAISAVLFAPGIEKLPPLAPRIGVFELNASTRLPADPWTAAVVAFHDHDQEPSVFRSLLGSDCFTIMAIGSRKAHEARIAMLLEAGFNHDEIARVKSPAGLIPGLRTAPQVAVSILAEAIDSARRENLL